MASKTPDLALYHLVIARGNYPRSECGRAISLYSAKSEKDSSAEHLTLEADYQRPGRLKDAQDKYVLSDAQLAKVKAGLAEAAVGSWEIGTRIQALLEFDAPSYSVYTPAGNTLPFPKQVPTDVQLSIEPVFAIARDVVRKRNASNNNTKGPQQLMKDGSAADPVSIGVGVLLAGWTGQSTKDGLDYFGAATDQLEFLWTDIPRTWDGAFSHRMEMVQLRNDYLSMVPPFLVYYATSSTLDPRLGTCGNTSCWAMGLLGSLQMTQGTGPLARNAWVAAGALRVLATIKYSSYADSFINEQADLVRWTKEIHAAMYRRLDETGIFKNYVTNDPEVPISSSSFYDAASTALLASTVYRLSVLEGECESIQYAERSRKALFAPHSKHITEEGWLKPVVNPYNYRLEGSKSAEGQAFVLMLHAAWRDWVEKGSPGT
uniref:Six-hairpin glycosidase-like protein n=1 Tax=Moniliophthora roreri TaxID=221103 RepID=A0A0W0G484_MONRR